MKNEPKIEVDTSEQKAPPKILVDAGLTGGGGFDGVNGGGFGGSGGYGGRARSIPPASGVKLAVWIWLLTLSIGYAAATLLYVSRLSTRAAFPFTIPSYVWINTLLLLSSSLVIRSAYHNLRIGKVKECHKLIMATVGIGLTFVAGQFWSWHLLSDSGMMPSTNIFGGFFYFFTGLHAFHLLSGIGVLIALLHSSAKGRYSEFNYLPIEMGTLYWHYLNGVWVWLFFLLLLTKIHS